MKGSMHLPNPAISWGCPPSSRELESMGCSSPGRPHPAPLTPQPGTLLNQTHWPSCQGVVGSSLWVLSAGKEAHRLGLRTVSSGWKQEGRPGLPPNPLPSPQQGLPATIWLWAMLWPPGQADLRWGLQTMGSHSPRLGDPECAPRASPGLARNSPPTHASSDPAILPKTHTRTHSHVTY